MAAASPDRLPLTRGETLLVAAAKRQRGFPKPLPRPYAEARYRLFQRMESLAAKLRELPPEAKYPGATVLALRLHPDFLGAAYEPDRLLGLLPAAAKVGARPWRARLAEVAPTPQVRRGLDHGLAETVARLVFLSVDESPFLEQIDALLEKPESKLTLAVRNDLQRIEEIGFLTPAERIAPFPAEWAGGRVELVLHPCPLPFERRRLHLFERLEAAGIDFQARGSERVRFRSYPGAPLFVSLPLDRPGLDRLRDYNPLRTGQLLEMSPLPVLRAGPTLAAPRPPAPGPVSPIRVAVFDGGFDDTLPLLENHAVPGDSLSLLPPHPDCVAHGTAVIGAILHGALNAYPARAVLPPPPVSVVAYRVFPLSDPVDLDLYEAIDAIERTVPQLEGIRVINLSFGPRGPVSDDSLSRFTYALDRLAYEWNVLPVVAVGNDGAVPDCGRIQAPSDAVNALSVGAYSHYDGENYPVPYSCRGPGREGAKGKPDLAAFGGCERTPFHLVSTRAGLRVLDHGTSFAAPLVTRRCAELLGRCPDLPPLLLRALLIHHSRHPGVGFDFSLGHGLCPDDIDEIVGCPPKTVSVLLNHAIEPKGVVRLPLPLPSGVAVKGKVEVSWTLAVLAPVNPLSSLEYTSSAVAATFYPDSRVFTFTPPTFLKPRPAPRKLNLGTQSEEAAALLSAQWTQSEFPVSRSANVYREAGLSGGDLKWDTVNRCALTLQGSSLHEPFLLLQASSRHGEKAPVRFAGVISLRMPGTEADIYEEVIRAYPSLQKIAVHAENEVRVTV